MNTIETIGPAYTIHPLADDLYRSAAVWNVRKNAEAWAVSNGWPKSCVKPILVGASMKFKQYIIIDACGMIVSDKSA